MSVELRPQSRPSLDHYVGREVTFVGRAKKSEKHEWEIHLAGNIIIKNLDTERVEAPEVKELQFLLLTLGEMDTRLIFGNPNVKTGEIDNKTEISLNPIKYSITDPKRAGGREIEPQRLDPEERAMVERLAAKLPPDPSAERVAEGPQRGEEMSEGQETPTPEEGTEEPEAPTETPTEGTEEGQDAPEAPEEGSGTP
jgi:hypothetical protein